MVNLCVFLLLGFFISGTDSQCATSARSMADQMKEMMNHNADIVNNKSLPILVNPSLGITYQATVNFNINNVNMTLGKTSMINANATISLKAPGLNADLHASISANLTFNALYGCLAYAASNIRMTVSLATGTMPMLPPPLDGKALAAQVTFTAQTQVEIMITVCMNNLNKANTEFCKPFTVGNTLCQHTVTNVTVKSTGCFMSLATSFGGKMMPWTSSMPLLGNTNRETIMIPDKIVSTMCNLSANSKSTSLTIHVNANDNYTSMLSALGVTAGGNINVTVKTPPVLSSNQVQATAQVMASVIISNGTGTPLLSMDANLTYQANVTIMKGNFTVALGTAVSVTAMPPSIPCGCPNGTNSPAMEKFLFNIASSMSVNLNAAMEHTGTMVSPSGLQGAVNTTPMQGATKCTREFS